MAEKRINDCAGTSYSDFQQKRFRTSSSENTAQSNNYGADRSESTALGNEHYNGATDDSEHLEDSDDDDADRSLLYCILLSDNEEIDLNKDDWYQKLTDIRKSCGIKNRSREEDILSIQSMSKTSSALRLYGSTVSCFSEDLDENEDDRVYKCLTFNKDYEKFLKVTPTEVFRKCMPGYFIGIILRTCDISDFVWKAGLDFFNIPIDCLIENQEKTLDCLEILNLPYELGLYTTEFKEYVENIMELEQKSLQSLNLNSLLGSFLIGGQERKEKVLDKLSLSQTKWNILVSILTSETYSIYLNTQLEEQSTKIQESFPLLTCESKVIDKDINELVEISKVLVLHTEINKVGFISDDVRHQVMSYFVKNCLITDDDFENYIKLSSVDSLLEYVCTWWYSNEEEERCLYLPERMEEAFIQKLGLDVLLHVMVAPRRDSDFGSRYKTIREKVQENLKLPYNVFDYPSVMHGFVEFIKKITNGKQSTVQSLNLNSLLGSYLIGRQINNGEGLEHLSLSKAGWNILLSILTSETYSIWLNTQLEEQIAKLQKAFPVLRCEAKVVDNDVTELVEISKVLVLHKENTIAGFISDDVRHQVMSYFVKNCLITDDDFEKYIKLSSVDSLLEYVRTWWYKKDKDERCLYLPESMEDAFIRRLGLDAIRHVMVEMREDSDYRKRYETIREKVKEKLNVPEEIFDWKYEARCRYVECAKRGTKTIHRARAMIVGCAGAGKTTLLKRLQKLGLEELMKVHSTVGLEVHEDMFELGDGNSLKALSDDTNKDDKQILSVVDFGGQCAYYACHQVYLSRRAFYVLVMDMSKPLKEKVDESRCEQRGTMFADWTYGEYVLFWLKSVHTYCAEDTSIIIVATHSENITRKDKNEFYGHLLDLLPSHSNLKKHLNHERCFFVSFPGDKSGELDLLSELESCIVSIAKDGRWKEKIPKEWSVVELALINLKGDSKKIISMTELEKKYWMAEEGNVMKLQDALRFFHDIGLILYFDEESLSDTIVVDVQWFVDTFKFIISDKNHVRDLAETNKDWQYFHWTGYLMDNFLHHIWERLDIDSQYRPTILHFMQRLGLLAIGEVKHYVPCMNKRDFGRKEQIALRGMETKSSVLVLHFHFLPFFFYCRLIVACIVGTEWRVVEDDGIPCLYKNIAIFIYKDHLIALVVTPSAIQVQILRPQNAPIDVVIAVHIKETLENRLGYLTSTFHKKVAYRVAFQCSSQDVLCESEECYVYEEEISKKGQILCPRHGFIEKHLINEEALTRFSKTDTSSETGKVPLTNEEKIRKLVTLGRDAMQVYFNSIFPPQDLQKCLKDNKEILCNGPFRFTAPEVNIVYPAGNSIVQSSSFDVPIMYKLLRNFGNNVPPPTNGWGKEPTVGQKTHGDDIERIRKYRNKFCHNHFNAQNMDDDDFVFYWAEMTQAILRLTNGSFRNRIDTIRQ